MKKHEKINLRKSAEKSIKEAKKRGEIKKKYHPDGTQFQLGNNIPIPDRIVYDSTETLRLTGESLDIQNDFINYDPQIATNTIVDFDSIIGNSAFSPLNPPEDLEHKMEKKIEQVHEQFADQRKYTNELEEKITSLTTVVTKLIHEKNRLQKRFKDHQNESQEWLEKYGGAMLYVKNKIIEMQKENRLLKENSKLNIKISK